MASSHMTKKSVKCNALRRPAPPEVQMAQQRLHLELRVHVLAEHSVVGPLDRRKHSLQFVRERVCVCM